MKSETTSNVPDLRKLSLVELKQRRAAILKTLVECNAEKEDDASRVAARGLELELNDTSVEIEKREGREQAEANAARRQFNAKNASSTRLAYC
ncbi:MAG: hypothetical protein ACREQW_21640 [Candidatus Binatia bacterium]